MIDLADDLSSRESTGTSMRTWLYLGAAVLALMLLGLSDRITEDVRPGDGSEQSDPGSARHASTSALPAAPERAITREMDGSGSAVR